LYGIFSPNIRWANCGWKIEGSVTVRCYTDGRVREVQITRATDLDFVPSHRAPTGVEILAFQPRNARWFPSVEGWQTLTVSEMPKRILAARFKHWKRVAANPIDQ
jgi:hypothetical protein